MDVAIKHHFDLDIIERERLTGGFSFQTWLLTLSNHRKVVFRHQEDWVTGSGGKIIVADVLEREKFFYETMRKSISGVFPEVYVVDGTYKHHKNAFCVMEYLEGTPLNRCFSTLDTKTQNRLMYKIGEIAAQINNINIDNKHPYIQERASFEGLIADNLWSAFIPLISNGIIAQDEADKIVSDIRSKKASKTLSFLHLDMRHCNIILSNDNIFVVDAANCEFGDPLWELAIIDVGGELTLTLIEGYKSAYVGSINLEDDLYYYYKMERMALVVDLYLNVKAGAKETQKYLEMFMQLKQRLLSL